MKRKRNATDNLPRPKYLWPGMTWDGHRVIPDKDEYRTPAHATLAILEPYLPKNKVIWEAAWGAGQLAGPLRSWVPDRWKCQMDFLRDTPPHWDVIVTNPPFRKKDQFLERAYALGKPFAFLLPLEPWRGKDGSAL